jgi:uncharacterized membrane protein YeaQ/YmgE (transglycosylase-associated protein family)
MGVITWIFFGLVVGAIAKFFMPGDDPGGCVVTILLGIVGAAVGGAIGAQLGWGTINDFSLHSIGLAVMGAVIVLLGYRAISRRK